MWCPGSWRGVRGQEEPSSAWDLGASVGAGSSARLANKQDAAAALLPCELIERLCLERLVNENRSPCRIEENAKGPRRRKRKVKVKKKGSGQPSPAEEPEGAGAGGDSRAGAAGGLLLPNRVGQEEPTATSHPAQGTKRKKKKKIKNKIKSREPSLEQQREEVSSTF
ncbi:hypothetical protein Nmel_012914, partial [Mimus melanotis]